MHFAILLQFTLCIYLQVHFVFYFYFYNAVLDTNVSTLSRYSYNVSLVSQLVSSLDLGSLFSPRELDLVDMIIFRMLSLLYIYTRGRR